VINDHATELTDSDETVLTDSDTSRSMHR